MEDWEVKPNRADYADVKEYRRAYDRWRDKNDPKRLARNTDPIRQARTRAWYAANRETVLEQKKAYFQENKAQIRDYQRDYVRDRYRTDPEFRAKSIARAQASNKADPERKRVNNERYRADPDNKQTKKAANIKYREENLDKISAQTARFRGGKPRADWLQGRQNGARRILEKARALVA